MRHLVSIVAGLAIAAGGLGGCSKEKSPRATATLESRSGSNATGEAVFVEVPGGVKATITVAGATPGQHGLHIHTTGDCSALDAESAGPHWNPDTTPHGPPGGSSHAGDMGNIVVGADGKGRLDITLEGRSVKAGSHSVVGHAVVLHGNADDLMSQPAGNAGPRIACGVIAEKK
ncbi:MAG TPA: superoxide dismutase family protein [Kofleriaceae bacterium]|nr:superoxide dismutase family protein [Kofleriaceae bacterium]